MAKKIRIGGVTYDLDGGGSSGGGTVTSVTVRGQNGINGSGTVTSSGTITLENSGVRSITQDNTNKSKLKINTNGSEIEVTLPNTTYDPVTDSANGLMTSAMKKKLDGIDLTEYATTDYVDNAIEELPEPMIFKGSLGTGGTITTLPSASKSNTGFTYKVITDGTYQNVVCKAGDTLISDGSKWVLIPSGDEPSGTVTSVAVKMNGVVKGIVTSSGVIDLGNVATQDTHGSLNGSYDANTKTLTLSVS